MDHAKEIHVEWEGPLTLKEARGRCEDGDWGVYQVYGFHPNYGPDVLLYIGKAAEQHFGTRLRQEKSWDLTPDPDRLRVYLGRLGGVTTPDYETWSRLIGFAERLLIFAHCPPGNAQKCIDSIDKDLYQVHLFNWGSYRAVFPEISGARWLSRLSEVPRWHSFRMSDLRVDAP